MINKAGKLDGAAVNHQASTTETRYGSGKGGGIMAKRGNEHGGR